MIKDFKIFEKNSNDITPIDNYEVIGENHSRWSWEYDSSTITAKILLDKSNYKLYLQITKYTHSSGLGGNRSNTYELEFENVGDIYKPKLAIVRSLLKKHKHEKSTTGSGFSRMWSDEEGNVMSLGDLISFHKPEEPIKIEPIKTEPKPRQHIKTKQEFDSKKSDIELVEYSQYSFALFGKGTITLKDKLREYGRYNKFLTNPVTKQKMPGWIFSNKHIDKVKEIIL